MSDRSRPDARLSMLLSLPAAILLSFAPLFCQGLPLAAPEEAGMDAARLERAGRMLEGYVGRGELAGTVCLVARHGRVVYLDSRGVRSLESGAPMTDDSIFRIYSMTKPVASAALMMLYEEGLFQLDDPVSKYIPEFARIRVYGGGLKDLERPITVRDLLIHTSALNYSFPGGSELQEAYERLVRHKYDGTLAGMVRELVRLPISHQPGKRWQYSTLSTDVVGYLVEVLSGVSFERFLHERIFGPLGMADTGFHVPASKLERFTAMYGPAETRGGKIELIDAPETSRYSNGPASYFSGGEGLVSTASDYWRFAQMMLNGGELGGVRILGRKTVELMTVNHLPEEMIPFGFGDPALDYVTRGYGFGLGYAMLMDVPLSGAPGTEGLFKWAGAANTDHWIDPGEDLVAILLTQFRPNGHYPVDRQFRTLVYQALAD